MINEITVYLQQILQKYRARDLTNYSVLISQLKTNIQKWAGSCFIEIKDSGSRAKGTAISLTSDVDYLISLKNGCNQNLGGLEFTYNQLHQHLITAGYKNARKQNVSTRVNLSGLEVDITPACKLLGNTHDHSMWSSKRGARKQTNIQRHIKDVSESGRTDEIKLLKIWRELNKLDFPSVYLEYLLINDILLNRSLNNLADNMSHILNELSKDNSNPLYARVIDPANSNNILSDLLDQTEKTKIIAVAKRSIQQNWGQVFY